MPFGKAHIEQVLQGDEILRVWDIILLYSCHDRLFNE